MSPRGPRHIPTGVVSAGEAVDENVGGSTRPAKAPAKVGSHARKTYRKGRALQRRFDRLAGPVTIKNITDVPTRGTEEDE